MSKSLGETPDFRTLGWHAESLHRSLLPHTPCPARPGYEPNDVTVGGRVWYLEYCASQSPDEYIVVADDAVIDHRQNETMTGVCFTYNPSHGLYYTDEKLAFADYLYFAKNHHDQAERELAYIDIRKSELQGRIQKNKEAAENAEAIAQGTPSQFKE